jgi:iron complex outermembrane recepter protein
MTTMSPLLLRLRLQQALLLGVALQSTGVSVCHASANEATAPATDADVDNANATDLDSVQVKAQRIKATANGALGDRSALDTPYSVDSVDRQTLDQHQVISLASAFFGDASVTPLINDDGVRWASAGISIRGLSLSTGAGTKIDGLPTATSFSEWPLEAVERLDLLKGPAGFMYGFGAPGGIVNYVSKRPTDDPLLTATVGYRSDGIYKVHVDNSQRFGRDDRFGYRLNVAHEQGKTYDGADLDRKTVSLALDARLSDTLLWDATWTWQDRMLDNAAPYFIIGSGVTTAPRAANGGRDFGVDGAYVGVTAWSARTSLHWQFADAWKARFTVGRSHFDEDISFPYAVLTDNDGTYSLTGYGMGNRVNTNFVQAIVDGRFDTGPLQHYVVAGADWIMSKEDTPLGTVSGCNDCTGNVYTGAFSGNYDASARVAGHHRYGDTEQRAVYLSDTVGFLDHWSAILGARLNNYRFDSYSYTTGSIASSYEKKPLTPTIALLYKPREWTTLYASYVESLEEGSTVGTGYLNAGEILPAMVSKQYEAGFKLDGQRWSMDSAVFRIERAASIDEVVAAGKYLRQDGITRYEGAEVSLGFRANSEWALQGGVTWLDPTFEKLSPANAGNLGNRPAGTWHLQTVLQASYSPEAVPELELHAGARYYGDTYNDAANTLKLPSYVLVNAGAGYRTEWRGHGVTVRGEINNLTDKQYWSTVGLGAPRSVSLNATFAF